MDTVVIRTVLDGGGGSFKVMASVFDGASDPEVTFSMIETPSELNTGVNRLLPLAVVENCPERHHNLRQILEQLRLQEVEGLFIVGDLKIYNIMLGLSAHGGKYSCAYCLGVADLDSGEYRTFGHLQDHYTSYLQNGSNPKNMQYYFNTINKCLIVGEREERVLDKIMLPELHLMIGNCNHLLGPIKELWPGIMDWFKRNSIFWRGYQGGGLDGNNSRKFLQKLDILKSEVPRKLHPILETLKLFNLVVESCFSHELSSDYREKILNYKQSYKQLSDYCNKRLKFKLTVSWKVHCVTAHLEEFLTRQKTGLAKFAEQTGEAAHCSMKPVMKRHSRSEGHKDHGQKQMIAVRKFGSWNLKDIKQFGDTKLKLI